MLPAVETEVELGPLVVREEGYDASKASGAPGSGFGHRMPLTPRHGRPAGPDRAWAPVHDNRPRLSTIILPLTNPGSLEVRYATGNESVLGLPVRCGSALRPYNPAFRCSFRMTAVTRELPAFLATHLQMCRAGGRHGDAAVQGGSNFGGRSTSLYRLKVDQQLLRAINSPALELPGPQIREVWRKPVVPGRFRFASGRLPRAPRPGRRYGPDYSKVRRYAITFIRSFSLRRPAKLILPPLMTFLGLVR